MSRVAVAGEDRYFVTQFLQANGSVNNKTFSTADAEVGMKKYDIPPMGKILHLCRVVPRRHPDVLVKSTWKNTAQDDKFDGHAKSSPCAEVDPV